ncbi:hypothetical protein HanIR_Chr11g0503501 [Helianthus annuus]|nr:hypothetical protein HanIR_Chr11g0503501 [Helianthus annuus]
MYVIKLCKILFLKKKKKKKKLIRFIFTLSKTMQMSPTVDFLSVKRVKL